MIPVGFALYLTWYLIDRMSVDDREKVSQVFTRANYFFIFVSVIFSWLSHYFRALRWRYLLEPMGYKPRFWNSYHAVMIGYFMNLLLPRAGEVSRAGFLARYEKIPFEKSFGTILAERVIDALLLGLIALVTIAFQYDKFDELWIQLQAMKTSQDGQAENNNWVNIVLIIIAAAAVGMLVLYAINRNFRNRVHLLIRGLGTGLTTILHLKKRGAFIFYSLLIWLLYILMYLVCFYAIEETSHLPLEGMMLGFLGGSIGIILVQGGIGVYPMLVATALALYGGDYGAVYALGWIVWLAQTLLLVVAGGISFYFMPRFNRKLERTEEPPVA